MSRLELPCSEQVPSRMRLGALEQSLTPEKRPNPAPNADPTKSEEGKMIGGKKLDKVKRADYFNTPAKQKNRAD